MGYQNIVILLLQVLVIITKFSDFYNA